MRRIPALVLILSLLLTALGGCASRYGEQKTTVNYYPGCYRPIQDLRQREHEVAKGGAGGAAIGALGGALIGLLATGKWQGAVAGAAVGAAGGGIVGASRAKAQQERDDNKRMAAYLEELDGDISNLDIASAAARTSLQCYDQQFALLLKDIKVKTINRETAAKRFAEISSGREEAIAILGNAANQARNLDQQYEEAFVNEERQAMQNPVRQPQKRQAIQVARQKKQKLTLKTASLEQEKNQANEITLQQAQEARDALADAKV